MSMAEPCGDDVDKLYEYGERLTEATNKSQLIGDYEAIFGMAEKGSVKVKQLASQLIPRFFSFFPSLSEQALDRHFWLCEDEDLGVRVQAIRGLPLFCKDNLEHLPKVVDVLAQLLPAGANVERDAVHKSLMTLLRKDVKTSLTTLFNYLGNSDEAITDENREKVICFIKDKIFPLKAELLKPQEEMERHITDLVKKSLLDVTGTEFKMFMDFLTSLSIFGKNASAVRVQELVEIVGAQADLDAPFDVLDGDHIDRLLSCLRMAIPFFVRGASSSTFLNYLNKHILPVFDKLPEERKTDLLKNLAECAPYASPQDSRQALPSILQILKKHMVRKKVEEINFTYLECLLSIFHHLSHKTPNATNSLCGYKFVTGQPSDRLGEDFSEQHKDFMERLSIVEDLTKIKVKKLTQGMSEQNKEMSAAKTDEAKDIIKKKKQSSTVELRVCNNILAMIQPLRAKAPSFIGDKRINLSWKEAAKPSLPSTTPAVSKKRAALNNDSSTNSNKRGREAGGVPNQLVNRVFESVYGRGRGGGRRGTWRGGRGRGYGR